MVHEIKLRDEFEQAVLSGEKSFEIRNNDRGYQKGDRIRFKVVDSLGCEKVWSELNGKMYEITYVLNGWGLKDNYVALAIKECCDERNTKEA